MIKSMTCAWLTLTFYNLVNIVNPLTCMVSRKTLDCPPIFQSRLTNGEIAHNGFQIRIVLMALFQYWTVESHTWYVWYQELLFTHLVVNLRSRMTTYSLKNIKARNILAPRNHFRHERWNKLNIFFINSLSKKNNEAKGSKKTEQSSSLYLKAWSKKSYWTNGVRYSKVSQHSRQDQATTAQSFL